MTERTTWWEVTRWCKKPEPRTVVGETEKTITVEVQVYGVTDKRRTLKETSYSKHFRTKGEALLNIYERAQRSLDNAKEEVAAAKAEFDAAADAIRKESGQ